MIYNLQLRNLNFNHQVLRDAAGTARSAVKTQQKFREVLILGSDSGISNLIRYSKLEEICLRNKKKEKPVFFYYHFFFFKRDSWAFKVQYFTSESTQQQHSWYTDTL